ncbi:SMR family transporter [Klebsiella pneumoniae]|nr:SMR family transporter [Klebsiella pneumoniae]MCE7351625.1 SMR family transporter [Klebsiella pneumoniae]
MKMPAFEWVHVQLHQQKGMISLSPPTICNSAFLSLVLKSIPVGVAYAVWSGLGVVIITAIAWLLHGQKLDAWGFVGMGLIIAAFLLARSPSWKSLRRPTPW